MNSIHDHAAYKEGKESYFSNKGRYENRYPLGSTEYDAFERGWSQSINKDIDIDIDIAKEKYLKGKGY
ncbi:hypothetical protein [Stutzerimonas chloritidismutans]|uniref:hypothetical protein n=1 Tax=Stutzerimonas chloritidismutans TaxID=203192 RepID=UPI001D18F5CB|nr:hypothetical protein [Stutzerimonas chloritidismutans]UEG61608.1 hypothetical protein LLJ08_00235 [Stutzerimonas chloritidismutans]